MRARLNHSSSSTAARTRRAAAPAAPPRTNSTTTTTITSRRGRQRTTMSAAASPDGSGPPATAAAAAPIVAPPTAKTTTIPRREVPLATAASPVDPSSTELSVLTWNVLADGLAQHGGWTHLPSPGDAALAWEQRLPLLLAEVGASRADVVCLQECNRFRASWLPAMRALGYEGRLWQKPRSPCERYGADRDGLALFWRPDTLRLAAGGGGEEEEEGEEQGPSSSSFYSGPYRHLAPSPAALATLEEDEAAGDGGGAAEGGAACGGGGGAATAAGAAGSVAAPLQLEAASQGLIVAVFEDAGEAAGEPPRRLVVAVTHLKAKEGFEARRREQAAQLCELVRSAAAGGNASAGATPPTAVLVAGDFNAAPDSAAAELVRASPAEGGLGLRCLWDVPLAAAAAAGQLEAGGNGRKPPPPPPPQEDAEEKLLFTTWKFRGDAVAGGAREKLETIDHIFFGGVAAASGAPLQLPQPLVPLSRWASPSRAEIGCAALPCESYPSDHVAVLCRFAWLR